MYVSVSSLFLKINIARSYLSTHLRHPNLITCHQKPSDAAKGRLLQFFTGKSSIDVGKYAARLKENPKAFLVASDRKMVTILMNKAKKLNEHAYLLKKRSVQTEEIRQKV